MGGDRDREVCARAAGVLADEILAAGDAVPDPAAHRRYLTGLSVELLAARLKLLKEEQLLE